MRNLTLATTVFLSMTCEAFADLAERVVSEAPSSLAALETSFRSVEFEAKVTSEMAGGPTTSETWKYKRNGDWQLFEQRPGDVTQTPLACGINSTYAFKIGQDAGQDTWLVREASPQYRDTHVLESVIAGQTFGMLDAAYLLPYGLRVGKLLQSPGFDLLSAEDRGAGLVEVKFEYKPVAGEDLLNPLPGPAKARPTPAVASISGLIILDSSQDWRIVEYSTEWKSSANQVHQMAAKTRYANDLPASVEFTMTAGGMRGTKQLDVTKAKAGPIPEREFKLAAYGLPDFGEPAPAPTSFLRIGSLVATALVVIALLSVLVRRAAAQRRLS